MAGIGGEWIEVSPERFFSSGVGPRDCSNVVLIELERQLWTYVSSLAKSQVPLNVELEVVGDEYRCEDDGVWEEWLDNGRRFGSGFKIMWVGIPP
jgi:hypothetical protein